MKIRFIWGFLLMFFLATGCAKSEDMSSQLQCDINIPILYLKLLDKNTGENLIEKKVVNQSQLTLSNTAFGNLSYKMHGADGAYPHSIEVQAPDGSNLRPKLSVHLNDVSIAINYTVNQVDKKAYPCGGYDISDITVENYEATVSDKPFAHTISIKL
ncbi:MAG: hypothetical protein QM727_03830 [Niabella sp.]